MCAPLIWLQQSSSKLPFIQPPFSLQIEVLIAVHSGCTPAQQSFLQWQQPSQGQKVEWKTEIQGFGPCGQPQKTIAYSESTWQPSQQIISHIIVHQLRISTPTVSPTFKSSSPSPNSAEGWAQDSRRVLAQLCYALSSHNSY